MSLPTASATAVVVDANAATATSNVKRCQLCPYPDIKLVLSALAQVSLDEFQLNGHGVPEKAVVDQLQRLCCGQWRYQRKEDVERLVKEVNIGITKQIRFTIHVVRYSHK